MALWDWTLEDKNITAEAKAKIRAAQKSMQEFDFLFGCELGRVILTRTDNLSKTLQSATITAAEGQSIASQTVKVLEKYRTDEAFQTFWAELEVSRETHNIDEPVLPKVRKRPARYETGNTSSHHIDQSPEEMYRRIYFQAMDTTINSIKSRFDQHDWGIMVNTQELLFKAIQQENFEAEIEVVCQFYNDDLDRHSLSAQLEHLPGYNENNSTIRTAKELIDFFQNMKLGERENLGEVQKLVKLLLVMPATNAVSERSFSAMKRIKSYLRSTMSNNRMNHLMIMHVHKDKTDKIDMTQTANSFIGKTESRRKRFGHF